MLPQIDSTNMTLIKHVVLNLMGNGRLFTSVDVTNIARQHGLSKNISNRQVGNWLRNNVTQHLNEIINSNYIKNLITVDSFTEGMTQAYCYHPEDVDSSEYLDRDQAANKTTNTLLYRIERGFKRGELHTFVAYSDSGKSKYGKY